MKYHCKHCNKTVNRISNKAWVKSYCEKTGRTVHLMRAQSRALSAPNGQLHTYPS